MKSKTDIVENGANYIEYKEIKMLKTKCPILLILTLISVTFCLLLYHVHIFGDSQNLGYVSLFLVLCCTDQILLEFIIFDDFESWSSIIKNSHWILLKLIKLIIK